MTSPKKPPESERPATAILVQPSSPRFPITPTGAHRKNWNSCRSERRERICCEMGRPELPPPGRRCDPPARASDERPLRRRLGLYRPVDGNRRGVAAEAGRRFRRLHHREGQRSGSALVEAQIPVKIHIVKDHDMKERLCLEVEKIGIECGDYGFPDDKDGNDSGDATPEDKTDGDLLCPLVQEDDATFQLRYTRMPEFANAGICWVLCKNGVFSVRSFYDALEAGRLGGRILTMDQLKRKRMGFGSIPPLRSSSVTLLLLSHNPVFTIWAAPISLAATTGIAFAFFSSGYYDVLVCQVKDLLEG
ncbi:hypothetical protein CK203_044262 [Vitis vinifera]|uniref:Uncharacterized protein n=1 Tax=Vitis vinifera TaxID=29760 RepID=A0A438GVA0_VITVI|nr:hypothetical protein CK203_044262 [Vitis vinifera]